MPDAENAILEIGGLANERAEEKFKDDLVSPGLAINKNFLSASRHLKKMFGVWGVLDLVLPDIAKDKKSHFFLINL